MEFSNVGIVFVSIILSLVGYIVHRMDKKVDRIDDVLIGTEDRPGVVTRIALIERSCDINHGITDGEGRPHRRRKSDMAVRS